MSSSPPCDGYGQHAVVDYIIMPVVSVKIQVWDVYIVEWMNCSPGARLMPICVKVVS